ncbi:Predicted GTPase [uncultured Clostridium sp.]|nr:Predicted GTPase [uncultured Clostridium sp.]
MAQVEIKYNPYKMETDINVNGKDISNDSILYKVVKGKRLQEWIGQFPQMLVDELNTVDFDIKFYGMALDWDDFEDAFNQAKEKGKIKKLSLKFIEGKSDDDINDKIVEVFKDLQEGPVDDFRDPKLARAFSNINNSVFPINVIATMSSGKSTLINALLGKRLMPSKNEACTATITELLDNDCEVFEAVVYDQDEVILREVPELTYDVMSELNDDGNVYKIAAKGNIPFLDATSTALMLVDTPGPNNSQNQAHKNTTYRAINNDSNNLILYVLNGTQLSTNDDAALLSYVAEQIKKGGKQVRDRFLFVINKMDGFNPEEEDIGKAITAAKRYLASYGIEDPQIFPCSAYAALNIRTCLDGIDINNLPWSEWRKLPSAARDTLPMIDKFIDYESMHLEQYSTLSPSAQRELDYKLSQAEEKGDIKEQALIHCGIYSIEAAITAYVKKYAKTKKVKDLVESFQEVLESTQVLAKAKTQVATDEEAAKACGERAAAVKEKIADGKEAEAFKARITALDPLPSIEEKAESLKEEATRKTGRVFEPYGDKITNREEAKRLVAQFTTMGSDYIAELTSELESIINKEVMETGERILTEYQEKLSRIDEDATDKQLDFGTVDLIKGVLSNMRENAAAWCSDDFASETVDDVGETTYEEKVYYEKVGQEEEKVADGTEKVKVGTKKVKVGSHREKTGTRTVKNPKKKGFFGFLKFWESSYIEEDVYETVNDYKDEDVYETVVKYKTVMRDIYAEHRETIEKFAVETAVIQTGLVSKLRRSLDEGIESALGYASEQIETMKKQFTEMFDELDDLIKQKYTELEQCASDQKMKEKELQENRKILSWIETCRAEIDDILNI